MRQRKIFDQTIQSRGYRCGVTAWCRTSRMACHISSVNMDGTQMQNIDLKNWQRTEHGYSIRILVHIVNTESTSTRSSCMAASSPASAHTHYSYSWLGAHKFKNTINVIWKRFMDNCDIILTIFKLRDDETGPPNGGRGGQTWSNMT